MFLFQFRKYALTWLAVKPWWLLTLYQFKIWPKMKFLIKFISNWYLSSFFWSSNIYQGSFRLVSWKCTMISMSVSFSCELICTRLYVLFMNWWFRICMPYVHNIKEMCRWQPMFCQILFHAATTGTRSRLSNGRRPQNLGFTKGFLTILQSIAPTDTLCCFKT